MIEANELTLGNWVYYDEMTHYPMQVTLIFDDEVEMNFEGNEGDFFDSYTKHIEPIPLTKEILLKNGFQKTELSIELCTTDDTYELTIDENTQIAVIGIDGDYEFTCSKKDKSFCSIPNVGYVHQLQNCIMISGNKFDFKV